MADRSDVSQFVPLVGADDAETLVSQAVPLVGADDAAALVSQIAPLVGADDARAFVSQFVLLVGRGPEVVPPTETPVDTFTFDEGLGNEWFIALQLSDSGDELRDKVVKSVRVTGKTTRAMIKVYGYGPLENVNVSDIEEGTGQRVTQPMPDTTQVQQSKRFPINVPHSMMHTVRVEGIDDGAGIRDRIDEIVYEVSRQGIRR